MPESPLSSNANHAHMHLQEQTMQDAWRERFKHIFHRDKQLHDPGPFCLFWCCPCHEDPDLKQRLLDHLMAGLISINEMNCTFLGKML